MAIVLRDRWAAGIDAHAGRRGAGAGRTPRGAAVAAGALNSPQLLQLSGIGTAPACVGESGHSGTGRRPGSGREPAGSSADPADLPGNASLSPRTTSCAPLGGKARLAAQWLLPRRRRALRIGHQPGRFVRPRAASLGSSRHSVSCRAPCQPTWRAAMRIRFPAARIRSANCGRNRAAAMRGWQPRSHAGPIHPAALPGPPS